MEDLLKTAINAPIGALLVVTGIAFLAFASIGNVDGRFQPGLSGRIGAAVVGVVLLLIGLILQWPPRSSPLEIATYFESADHKLDAADLKQAFGRAHHSSGVAKNGEHWSNVVTSTGDMQTSWPNFTDSGHSRIKDDQICVAWNKDNGRETCHHYARLADGRFAAYGPNGEFLASFTVTYP